MSDLQKIIVLCLLLAVLGIGFYFGSQSKSENGVLDNNEDSQVEAQINPSLPELNPELEDTAPDVKPEPKPIPTKPTDPDVVGTKCPDVRPETCTGVYQPVCGLAQVECITTPCNPVPEDFSNACVACSNSRVISYTEGMCKAY